MLGLFPASASCLSATPCHPLRRADDEEDHRFLDDGFPCRGNRGGRSPGAGRRPRDRGRPADSGGRGRSAAGQRRPVGQRLPNGRPNHLAVRQGRRVGPPASTAATIRNRRISDEVAHGIEVEGWKCGPYGGPVEATRGTKDPQRMREICQSCPAQLRQAAVSVSQAGRRTCPAFSARPAGHDGSAAAADRRGEAAGGMPLAVGRENPSGIVHSAAAERAGGALEGGELERADADGQQAAGLVLALSLGRPDDPGVCREVLCRVPARRPSTAAPVPKITPLRAAYDQAGRRPLGDRADVSARSDFPGRISLSARAVRSATPASSRST